jgi:hypothetical protein
MTQLQLRPGLTVDLPPYCAKCGGCRESGCVCVPVFMYRDPAAEQFEALQETISQAADDEQVYLKGGNHEADYGDEWADAAEEKAKRFRLLAEWLESKGGFGGLIDQCSKLAEEYEAVRKERNGER